MGLCRACGAEFPDSAHGGPKKRVYCGRACENEWHKAHREEKYEFTCKQCGQTYKTAYADRNQYCSRECAVKAKWSPSESRPSHGPGWGRDQGAWLGKVYCRVYFVACAVCGNFISARHKPCGNWYCSDECTKQGRRSRQSSSYEAGLADFWKKNEGEWPLVVQRCTECGQEFTYRHKNRRRNCCSKKCLRIRWKRANPAKAAALKKIHAQKRVARKRSNGSIETIDSWKVFERDGWVCGICGKKVNRKLKFPHRLSATLDHIIPLARDGAHTYDNVECAHLSCNSSKGAGDGGQLRLAIA